MGGRGPGGGGPGRGVFCWPLDIDRLSAPPGDLVVVDLDPSVIQEHAQAIPQGFVAGRRKTLKMRGIWVFLGGDRVIFTRGRVFFTRRRGSFTRERVFFRGWVIFTPFEGEFYPSRG